MKELTHVEVECVSGAGALADSLGNIGSTLGGAMKLLGLKNSVENASAVGTNLGLTLESAFSFVTSAIKLLRDK